MQPKERTHMLWGVNNFTMAASRTRRDLTEACMRESDVTSKVVIPVRNTGAQSVATFPQTFFPQFLSSIWLARLTSHCLPQCFWAAQLCNVWLLTVPSLLAPIGCCWFQLYSCRVVWPVINNKHVWFFFLIRDSNFDIIWVASYGLECPSPIVNELDAKGITLIWDWGLRWCLYDVSPQF